MSAERRELPWVKVEKNYVFDTPDGKDTLAELFGGNSQLIVHHFMWRWDLGQGCVSCSFEADHVEARSCIWRTTTSATCGSRARLLEMLEAYKKRMGWTAKWVSSYGKRSSTTTTTSRSPRTRPQRQGR